MIFRQKQKTIVCELRFIKEINYASYLLTVCDIVRFARSQNILCQGTAISRNNIAAFIAIIIANPQLYKNKNLEISKRN